MNFQFYNYDDFFGDLNGIKIDNSYDQYTLNRYKRIIADKNINYINSQDNDLIYLQNFPLIEFITVPKEAENLDSLYHLKELKGLELYSSCLNKLDLNKFTNLVYLNVKNDEKIESFDYCKKIKHLKCRYWKIKSIKDLLIFEKLETLFLESCQGLKDLNYLEQFRSLNNININYCLTLEDISSFNKTNDNLKYLKIADCNKINNIDYIFSLNKLKSLFICNLETKKSNSLSTVKFINNMPYLENFTTNYKILDGDLTPLLRLNDVNLISFYKHYNLKDKDLPHIYVTIKDNSSCGRLVKLSELENGKENPNIMWMDELW